MQVDITMKNYRCFPDSTPARISIRPGFTAFVGVNNSGKSSLLRFFYEFRSLCQLLSSPSGNLLNVLRGGSDAFGPANSVLDLEEVFSNFNNRNLELDVRLTGALNDEPANADVRIESLLITVPRGTNRWLGTLSHCNGALNVGSDLAFDGEILQGSGNPRIDMWSLFRAFKSLSNTLYIGSFRNAINTGTREDYFDIHVGESFIRRWRTFKTGNAKRENEAARKVEEDIKHVFGFHDLSINASDDGQTLQLFIDGKSYRLAELGSGLAQFIMVLINAAIKQPAYILIDEPELNLHSSLQLDFLTTLGSFASEGVLFATHNIGLARAAGDLVYSLHKGHQGSEVYPLEATPRLSELLGELSFSGYRELGFNSVLLVEGSTEVKTIQQFLRWYGKDHQVVLLPLGGGQLIRDGVEVEIEEIKRISDNITVLIDSERSSKEASLEANRQAFVKLCEKADLNCHVLERRALENYFTDRAVKKVKGEKYRALAPYELLRDVSPAWAKAENWQIAREMTPGEFEGADLGDFLKSL